MDVQKERAAASAASRFFFLPFPGIDLRLVEASLASASPRVFPSMRGETGAEVMFKKGVYDLASVFVDAFSAVRGLLVQSCILS